MRRKLVFILLVILIGSTAITAYATDPTQAELDAFQAAMELYGQSNGMVPPDPGVEPPPTPEELKAQAITAFGDFITTYPESELSPDAQLHIGKCHYELNDNAQATVEYNKVVTDYPASVLVDDAKYMAALSDFMAGDHSAALTGFTGVITEYEGNVNEELKHLVPFAYFMVGEPGRLG